MSIRLKNGELKVSAIKALVKAHNKAMNWDIKGLNRSDLIKFIEKKGYKVNHEKNILELTGSAMKRRPAKIKPIVKSSAELKKEMEKKTKAKATREKKKQQKQAVAKVGVPPLPTKETLKKVQEKKKLKEQLKKGETKAKAKSVSIGTQTAPKKRLKGKLTAIQKKQTAKEKAKKELLKGTPPPMTKKKESSVLIDQDLKDEAKLKKETKEEKIMKTPLYKELLKLEIKHIKNLINDRKEAIKKGTTEGMHDKSNAEYEKQEQALRLKYKDTKLPRSLLYIFNKDKVVSKLIKEHDALGKKLPKKLKGNDEDDSVTKKRLQSAENNAYSIIRLYEKNKGDIKKSDFENKKDYNETVSFLKSLDKNDLKLATKKQLDIINKALNYIKSPPKN